MRRGWRGGALVLALILSHALMAPLERVLSDRSVLYRNLSPFVWLFDGATAYATYIPSAVKSIQAGTISVSGTTATSSITAVVPAATEISMPGLAGTGGNNTDPSKQATRIDLASTTLVQGYVNTAPPSALTVPFVATEYLRIFVKSIQRGTVAMTSATVNTTISSVNTAKSNPVSLGWTTTYTTAWDSYIVCQHALTSATNLQTTVGIGGQGVTCGYEVVEFK